MTLDIQRALRSLREGEESVRREVVDELARSAEPEAIPPLLLAVADDSWPVRQGAVEGLTAFPLELLLPALEAALRDDENAGLRNAGMEIYVRLGGAAVPPLVGLLRHPVAGARHFAGAMLGALRAPRVAAPLIPS